MLKEILNQKIKDASLEDLKQKLEYQSRKKLEIAQTKFINTNTTYEWLHSGFYDLVYNARGFFIALCEAFEIPQTLIDTELETCDKRYKEIEKFKDAYIFVNTNFKRKGEPIIALCALDGKRRISLYKGERFLFQTDETIFSIVSDEIEKHYIKHNGKLAIWGDIEDYQLYLFGKKYIFNTNGKQLELGENQ